MKLRELYGNVVCSESKTVEYLRGEGIFSEIMPCPGWEAATCGYLMKLDMKRYRWRCYKPGCRKEVSMRAENYFFSFTDASGKPHSRLPLRDIVELMWFFLHSRMTSKQLAYVTGHGVQAVTDWKNLMREVCQQSLEAEPKMVGTATDPIQIDESFFSGRRKYGKGRLLKGNISNWGEEDPDDPITFGVDNPNWCWVLGIYSNKNDVRFLRVRDRSSATLIPIIERYVEGGSWIVTDLWGGYNALGNHGFVHKTVNHSENYVDPETGYHTQGIERAWRTAKLYLRTEMGNRRLFQSHLDEAAWKMKHGSDHEDVLPTYIDDIKTFYG